MYKLFHIVDNTKQYEKQYCVTIFQLFIVHDILEYCTILYSIVQYSQYCTILHNISYNTEHIIAVYCFRYCSVLCAYCTVLCSTSRARPSPARPAAALSPNGATVVAIWPILGLTQTVTTSLYNMLYWAKIVQKRYSDGPAASSCLTSRTLTSAAAAAAALLVFYRRWTELKSRCAAAAPAAAKCYCAKLQKSSLRVKPALLVGGLEPGAIPCMNSN